MPAPLGVGANATDRKEPSIATIRATDTALIKAGVERGDEEKGHSNSHASRGT